MNTRPVCLAILAAAFSAAAAYGVDFTVNVWGSRTVMQGYSTVFAVSPVLTSGYDESAYVSVTGLPAGSVAYWRSIDVACCRDYAWRITQEQPVELRVPESASPGTYSVTVTYRSFSGVTRSATFPLQVVAKPSPITPSYPSSVALAEVAQWQNNMRTYGLKHCVSWEADTSTEAAAWYYDGARVYAQIASALGDSSFLNCALMFNNSYRQYVQSLSGRVPAWRVFPHGLAMTYARTGDTGSRTADFLMADANPWSSADTINVYAMRPGVTREVAYAIETLIAAEKMGKARTWKLQFLVDSLLAQFDQFFSQRNAVPQPFMIGLAAEALIEWHDLTGDPRVLPALRLAADEMWSRSWNSASQSFFYVQDNGSLTPAADLNLLIAPMYGWVFQKTGATVYRDRGDVMFASGVRNAWLDGGKQFTQSYRWSGRYVEWRQPGASAYTPPPPEPSAPQPSAPQPSASTYVLTVNSGYASGSYAPGTSVTMTAYEAPYGHTFDRWTGATVSNPYSAVTTLIMPAANTTVTATYKSATVSSSSMSVTSLALINADTNQPVSGYTQLTDGMTIRLSALPTRNLNIQAVTNPSTVGSVRFDLNGVAAQVENVAPYALAGDNSGNYNGWSPPVGNITITATPFSGAGAGGSAGYGVTVRLYVVQ